MESFLGQHKSEWTRAPEWDFQVALKATLRVVSLKLKGY